jgi:hypothetical protein
MTFARAENPLNAFQQPTYHLTLLVQNPKKDARTEGSAESSETEKDIIVAQTGATRFNIKELQIKSNVSPSAAHQNSFPTEWSMTITEPAGLTFIDSLYLASLKLGIENWRDAEYAIEIRFKGFENGRENTNLLSDYPNGGIWRWQVMIANIDVQFDQSGGRYGLRGSIIHNIAFDHEIFRGPNETVIVADTVKEFFETLTKKMNNNIQRINFGTLKPAVSPPYFYEGFEFLPFDGPNPQDPNTFSLKPANIGEVSMQNLSMEDNDDKEKARFSIPRGTPVSTIITDIMSITREGQQLILGGTSSEYSLEKFLRGDFSGHRDSVAYMIHPKVVVDYEKFNPFTNKYTKNIKYIIKPFYTQKTVVSGVENQNYVGSDTSLQAILTYATLSKIYDYYFTGLNTEVIDADLKFNFEWTVIMPHFSGSGITSYDNARHARLNSKINDERGQLDNRAKLADQARQILDAAGAKGALPDVLEDGGNSAVITAAINDASRLASDIDEVNALRQAEIDALSAQISGGPLAEDLRKADPQTTNPFTTTVKVGGDSALRNVSNIGATIAVGAGKSVFGAIIEQTYGNKEGSLMNLNMTIRGDPFWLGMAYEQALNNSGSDPRAVNYFHGDACFILRFRYPLSRNEDGTPTWAKQDIFNGVYRVQKVTHDFNEGKFTQSLECVKNPRIRPDDIEALIAQTQDAIASRNLASGAGLGGI